MADDDFNAQDILDNGWRQFSVCQPGDARTFLDGCMLLNGSALPDHNPDDWWIVISQSCDLTNRSLDKEPSCEVLRAIPKQKKSTRANPDTIWAQNPREIALCNAVGKVLDATIHARVLIPRQRLQGKFPCAERIVPERHQYALRKWLAGRYSRPAFPGDFNDRLKLGEQALNDFLAQHEAFIRGVYCLVEPQDEHLDQAVPYRSQWLLVYRHAKLNDDSGPDLQDLQQQTADRAESLAYDLERLLTEAPILGIEAVVEPKPDDQFSLVDMDDFRYWDKDFISLQTDDGELLPPGVYSNP